jgi:formate-dependent nitrite reductase membrane component NrfD
MLKYPAGTHVKKEYRPMALGFWGVGLPLAVFGLLFCRTGAERLTVLVLAAVFVLVGALIYRARR